MLVDFKAVKKAEEVYLSSPLGVSSHYDPEYFWRAIETYLEHVNKDSEHG